jgi:Cu/Zn superoxide dismutase
MKNSKVLKALLIFTVSAGVLATTGCSKDDDDPEPQKKEYTLKVKDQIGISGTVTFTETSNTVTTVTIKMNGGSSNDHPAHIHSGAAVEGGAILITLNPVDAAGNSTTEVTKRDDNTPINFDQLMELDAYVNVHESASALGTIIAQADIGTNELTGTKKEYDLDAVNSSGVSGKALFEQRKSGHTLVTLSLNGTIVGGEHPSHIHLGSTSTIGGGPIKKTLSDVSGATGKSYTNVRALDDGTPITYDNWLVYDGYTNVHLSDLALGTILSQGDIGSNE